MEGACGEPLEHASEIHSEIQTLVRERAAERGPPDLQETEEEAANVLLQTQTTCPLALNVQKNKKQDFEKRFSVMGFQ